MNGTRLSAVVGEEVIGYIEVETFEEGERLSRHGGWADIGNLHISGQYRRRGVATWLLGQAADWLGLAQVERLLDYAWLEGQDHVGQDYTGYRAFLAASASANSPAPSAADGDFLCLAPGGQITAAATR